MPKSYAATLFDVAPPDTIFVKVDFLDNNGAHDTDSGILGHISLNFFDRFSISGVQALVSREIVFWKIRTEGAISNSVTVSALSILVLIYFPSADCINIYPSKGRK